MIRLILDKDRIEWLMNVNVISSYDELAKMSGVSRATIFRGLKGGNVTLEVVSKLADALESLPINIIKMYF